MPDAPPVTTATRLTASSVDGIELEMDGREATEDPRRLVLEAARVGRTVVLLGQPDVVHPVEDALEAHATLDAGERAAGARVGTASEGDVTLHVLAVDAELGRALEAPRIAVGGTVEQHHRRARGDVDTADRGRTAGEPEVGLHRALHAQHLLEERRDLLAVGAQFVLHFGVLGEVHQRAGEQAGGRLLAGGEQERGGTDDRA